VWKSSLDRFTRRGETNDADEWLIKEMVKCMDRSRTRSSTVILIPVVNARKPSLKIEHSAR
jgi:hypothetical protein